MFIFIHHDGRDVCRRHSVNHELRRVIIPEDDIDTLAAQLSGNRLHARAAHTDASANRVDTLVVGFHRDFGTRSRIASRRFDFQHFFTDFRHFDAEQFDQHLRFGTGHEQLGATRFRTDCVQYAANAVARAEVLTRQHIFTQDHGFSVVAQIQSDVVAVHFFHHAGDDLTFVLAELIDHHCALGFANFLHDNLFSGLGGDAVESDRLNLIFDVVTDVHAFIFETRGFQRDLARRLGHFFYNQPATESVEIAALTVDFNANVDLLFVFFLGGRCQRAFQRFENFLTRQRFFVGNGFNNSQNFFVHRGLSPQSRLLKVGNQVRLLDVTQREHFIFAFDGYRDHFTVYRFDNALPFATVLNRHAQHQRNFFASETLIVFGGEHRTVETRRRDFQVVSDSDRVFDIHDGAYLVAHISTIINVDAIFTINIDAQCGCATANKFDADQLKAKRFNRRSEHLCQFLL